jgi:hypothetical protein
VTPKATSSRSPTTPPELISSHRFPLAEFPQKYFKSGEVSQARKITTQITTTHHEITTTSPQKTIQKIHPNSKTPSKIATSTTTEKNPHPDRFHPRFPQLSSVYTQINMSTATISTVSVDEFQALEQKVLRAVEIVKKEREARAAAEAEATALREELANYKSNARMAETELTTLTKEREQVRVRVEKMLQQIDELL